MEVIWFDLLLSKNYEVIGIDNLEVGRKSNLDDHIDNPKFSFFETNICDKKVLKNILKIYL